MTNHLDQGQALVVVRPTSTTPALAVTDHIGPGLDRLVSAWRGPIFSLSGSDGPALSALVRDVRAASVSRVVLCGYGTEDGVLSAGVFLAAHGVDVSVAADACMSMLGWEWHDWSLRFLARRLGLAAILDVPTDALCGVQRLGSALAVGRAG